MCGGNNLINCLIGQKAEARLAGESTASDAILIPLFIVLIPLRLISVRSGSKMQRAGMGPSNHHGGNKGPLKHGHP